MENILIGISYWTNPTLIKGGKFYPSTAKTVESRLQYYASQFPMVETDSTYYGLPAEGDSRLWVKGTPDKFVFDIKAFRIFTLHPTMPMVLPRDIRERLPPNVHGKRNLYYQDLSAEIRNELWSRFLSRLFCH